jgi:CRISPR-associated protein Cas1
MLWPVAGYHAQQRRIEAQLAAPRPLCKRLWAQIVSAKILRQGWALERMGKPCGAFARLARQVASGDPENLEAQAARRYWPLLFGPDFRRDPAGEPPNGLLNYGYAVLRAATARAVVAAGLHPGLGIFHRHPNDAMPLADDLMEPFRPVIDVAVCGLVAEGCAEVTAEAKGILVECLQTDLATMRGTTPLATCLFRLAAGLGDSFQTRDVDLELPIVVLGRQDEDDAEGENG